MPGKLVDSATSATPLMIGEFRGTNEQRYVMVVNLSLETSAKFHLKTVRSGDLLKIVSPIDRSLSPFDTKAGYWLAPGQGVLLMLAE